MNLSHDRLQTLIADVFSAAGCRDEEANEISSRLVGANLVGHDSHGVIRVPIYVHWLQTGLVYANRELRVITDNGPLALVDGQMGFGQVMAKEATQMAIDKADEHGVAVVGLHNSGHVGRVGDWVEMAADAGKISLCFVNTTGLGMLTAPFGGIDRRLSANPLAAGIPVPGADPIILDISCSAIAEGKLKVAYNRGDAVPENCIIDSNGQPTTDPRVFYGDPPGAILPFGGHKGFGLGLVVEVLAGALTGSGCTQPGKRRLEQGMLSIVLDPNRFQPQDTFSMDVRAFIEFVKSSRTATPEGEVLIPGEPERMTRSKRLEEGIHLDDTTWEQIEATCRELGVSTSVF